MSHVRLRVKLNKGRRGVQLAKLESFIASMRRFLVAVSQDLDIPNPDEWAGVDFRNGSLEWTNESDTEVAPPIIGVFNETVTHLSKGQLAPQIQSDTSEEWFNVFETLEQREEISIGIYPEGVNRAKWLKVTREIALLPSAKVGLAIRESIGSVQGTVHAWYRESEPPYFTLRESATYALIKCFYQDLDYEAVVKAVRTKQQVIHVHGRVFTNTIHNCIRDVRADRIIPADPFSFNDFEKYWNAGKSQ
jgi:hypothetical protein